MKKNGELARLHAMYKYETIQNNKGIRIIAGVDEVGRGPLAGPVVAAVVILPRLCKDSDYEKWEGLNDSKKLSSKNRENLYSRFIKDPELHLGIGIVSERTIDKLNILRATQMAMRKALANLNITPDFLLIDGMVVPGVRTPQQKIPDGDCLSLSIAAASIVAKVTRDNIMCQYHEKYPQYGFDRHKGYGTKDHFKRLKEYGPCKIHRKSFHPIKLMDEIGYGEN